MTSKQRLHQVEEKPAEKEKEKEKEGRVTKQVVVMVVLMAVAAGKVPMVQGMARSLAAATMVLVLSAFHVGLVRRGAVRRLAMTSIVVDWREKEEEEKKGEDQEAKPTSGILTALGTRLARRHLLIAQMVKG
mmetsp:Transcript_64594/g.135561  ORF Transcript_64594/g.135561 Transcript_64594/m.135561 type:complete len:132 (-) Transcript_64594:1021-1416(-)